MHFKELENSTADEFQKVSEDGDILNHGNSGADEGEESLDDNAEGRENGNARKGEDGNADEGADGNAPNVNRDLALHGRRIWFLENKEILFGYGALTSQERSRLFYIKLGNLDFNISEQDVRRFYKSKYKIDLEDALEPEHYMACLIHPFYKRMKSVLYLAPGIEKRHPLFRETDIKFAEESIRKELSKTPIQKTAMPASQGNEIIICEDDEEANDELRLYLAEYFNVQFDVNVLQFWKGNEHRFPQLARIARKVFSVPASSASVERMFSCLRNLVDEKRTLLDKDLTGKLLVARHLS